MKVWTETPDIELFSDGGAEPNPGKGGFGVILRYKGNSKEFFQGYELTTNNRMELRGVIFGLEQLKTKSNVQVYTDSKYVIDGISKGWAEKWRSNGWRRHKNIKAINSDLWERLLNAIAKHEVTFNWVKGHAGHVENERCDALANKGINMPNKLIDDGYEPIEEIENEDESTVARNTIGYAQKVQKEGDACRKCGTPVVKIVRKNIKLKPNQTYYFEYVFVCKECKNIYNTEEAKREVIKPQGLF